jgi:hypothetical protein
MAFHCKPYDDLCIVFEQNRPLLNLFPSMTCFLTIPMYMALF